MEDFILREIDRIGEVLQHIARRLGLLNDNPPDYTLTGKGISLSGFILSEALI